MNVFIECPKCDCEIEFKVSQDYQGDGVWGMVVEFVDITEKKCDCEISDTLMNELTELASEKAADHDPANDID